MDTGSPPRPPTLTRCPGSQTTFRSKCFRGLVGLLCSTSSDTVPFFPVLYHVPMPYRLVGSATLLLRVLHRRGTTKYRCACYQVRRLGTPQVITTTCRNYQVQYYQVLCTST